MSRIRYLASVGIGLFALAATLITTGCGSSTTNVRLLNAVAGQSSVDMLVDSKDIAAGVPYGTASGYQPVSSGSRNLQIDVSGNAIISQTITLGSGTNNTVLATGSGATGFTDNKTAPSSGNIEIRVINASATLGSADVYIVPSGTDINTVNATIPALSYQSASSYQTLAAGSYEVLFTQPGQKFIVIDSNPLSFSSGQIRTVVGMDGQNFGFTAAVLSDLN